MAPHIILVCYPAQSHIIPCLQFAKVLNNRGAHSTIVTAARAQKQFTSASTITTNGISFAWISDGYDSSADVNTTDLDYHLKFNSHGPASLAELIGCLAASGHPVNCVAYNFLLPWAADVAAELGIPSALVWIQPAAVLSIYYHFTHDLRYRFGDLTGRIQLPGLPTLVINDLPSFLLPENLLPYILENLTRIFHPKTKWIFINSFDSLEPEVILALRSVFPSIAPVGPMITPHFINTTDLNEATKFCTGDLVSKKENGCTRPENKDDTISWLDSKPEGTVVYISFGTWAKLTSTQLDEVAFWLTGNEHHFLWVVRLPANYSGFPIGFEETVKQKGMVTDWCNQVAVLAHPSVGCFVTHSGWNSTLEGLVCGKPMVCVPQWSDQPTNAKFVQDVWKAGIRARCGDGGVVGKEELMRCVEAVMGEESGREMRENASKIKELAGNAMEEGGSSDRTIRAFIDHHTLRSVEVLNDIPNFSEPSKSTVEISRCHEVKLE